MLLLSIELLQWLGASEHTYCTLTVRCAHRTIVLHCTSVTYLRDGVKASAVRCRLEKKGRPVDTGSPELLHEPTDPELRGSWIGARTKRKTQHNSFKLNKGEGYLCGRGYGDGVIFAGLFAVARVPLASDTVFLSDIRLTCCKYFAI